ncbi:MAG: hypothetical protein P0Y55_17555 [Candidatus Cohnella colombiensis]|uniref:Uncharacterized protein n=1 Tax=Candidatus Cohnella colombiensis TaxID=3121368 RepID=A0AA95EWT5_9BACL|nr:MAG: hypothetical protein P0Y55_17555 [Cohnella sp.]
MASDEQLNIPQEDLVQAWQQMLPQRLNSGDSTVVSADAADPRTLLVNIKAAGRQKYDFDFSVRYVDSREIDIQVADVEKDGQTTDERSEVPQQLIADYRRHLHECAQSLHHFTHT